jgi:hypothetical protein
MQKLPILLVAMLLLFTCCKKEEPFYDAEGRGKGFAVKNGKNWETRTYAYDYKDSKKTVDVTLGVRDKNGILREALSFKNLELIEGERPIDSMHDGLLLTSFGILYSTILSDGDVTGDVYYSPAANPNNTLTVESYNEDTGELHCRFKAFVVGTPTHDLTLPDTLQFEDGWFLVKVLK